MKSEIITTVNTHTTVDAYYQQWESTRIGAGKPIYRVDRGYNCKDGISKLAMVKMAREFVGETPLLYELITNAFEDYLKEQAVKEFLFADDHTCVLLKYCDDDSATWFSFDLSSDNQELATKASDTFVVPDDSVDKTVTFSVISRGPSGFGVMSRKLPVTQFSHDNYNDVVVSEVNLAVQDFSDANPSGRLLILEGPPGTGKTYLIRALASKLEDLKFLIIDPSFVPELVGPSLINLLANEADNGGKMVLVLEDADDALVPRDGANMSLISSLLNITSGLYGQLFDLRVLATTNQKLKNIDAALLRPGRLCAHINVGALTQDKAQKVWERESGQTTKYFGPTTLSDVYHAAASSMRALKPATTLVPFKKVVGFGV